MSTRAIAWLKQSKIPFDVVYYDHQAKGAVYAADATGFPLAQTIKTLVVFLGGKSYGLALLAGNQQLSLKKAAKAFGVKKAAMADVATAERLTGYHVGGISPFGLRQRLRVVMEESLLDDDTVMINAGQRGVMLKMAPGDIRKAIGGRVGSIGDV
ncbi:MAG: aminoacyl-tRNA deacylase [Desulfobacterales bacterium]|jgi:Cys-tRNA(Pro)/Cys-tRNA(Cys) deacylase